jgi:hypothetical protein
MYGRTSDEQNTSSRHGRFTREAIDERRLSGSLLVSPATFWVRFVINSVRYRGVDGQFLIKVSEAGIHRRVFLESLVARGSQGAEAGIEEAAERAITRSACTSC